MSDVETNARHSSISRAALVMLVGVLSLGTVIAWSVVRMPASSTISPRGDTLPGVPQGTAFDPGRASALIQTGKVVVRQRCAGCHDAQQRLEGPSWQAIVARYQQHVGADPMGADALALMNTAISHPRPGWDGYTPGPSAIALTPDAQLGVAAWILSHAREENK
ncbi:Cytochrome c551/c552 [Pseudomonas frederiksbergensis]|uniref:Cytochrome c551/c552 n=1 Tax=Pseudomonas frederiksbergensis TaxID=104087 RepID=A0A1H5E8D0_9PSED|nr:hypothetical protein [Pseudomonas frederiksbergensis]SED87328.1 Cytochrome c551/c552 [Pseudomonas frederiksbergensis]